MIFRITTKHGMTIDIANIPADFSLMGTWSNIRMSGQFQNETLVVPLGSISFLTYGDVTIGTAQGNAPSTGTKQ